MSSIYDAPALRSLHGHAFKLVSAKGTLLGTITVPHHTADCLRERGVYEFCVHRPVRWADVDVPQSLNVHRGVLSRAYAWDWNDAVTLHLVSIEELEALPGYSFAPSAAYVRSLIE